MPSPTHLPLSFAAGLAILLLTGTNLAEKALAQEAHHYSFGYDQPHTTGYGIAGDLFAGKLAELSHGTMLIDQFPGAQFGQEPQMLQKIRTGDIDFISPRPPTPQRWRRNRACSPFTTCFAPRIS